MRVGAAKGEGWRMGGGAAGMRAWACGLGLRLLGSESAAVRVRVRLCVYNQHNLGQSGGGRLSRAVVHTRRPGAHARALRARGGRRCGWPPAVGAGCGRETKRGGRGGVRVPGGQRVGAVGGGPLRRGAARGGPAGWRRPQAARERERVRVRAGGPKRGAAWARLGPRAPPRPQGARAQPRLRGWRTGAPASRFWCELFRLGMPGRGRLGPAPGRAHTRAWGAWRAVAPTPLPQTEQCGALRREQQTPFLSCAGAFL
ncbi:MAG: hypothetical protein J3K34DRAFT_265711 [Monoraphidium minutum]|nr:MAG: hypothetical protein J3K34DRAFT_265711 [Monoraphidium minutum]